jgi:hypothetical protein
MVFEHFGIVFTQKILRMDFRNCFNYILISHKVTFHVEMHMSFGWLAL